MILTVLSVWQYVCGVYAEWSDSRMWLFACLNQEYTGCVSALRSVCGPLRQASGFRLHAPIGCFCLTKTQPELGLSPPPSLYPSLPPFFKKQKEGASLLYSLKKSSFLNLITSYFIDDTLLFWWDRLALMGPFVCNQHMNGIWIRVLFRQQACSSLLVCARAKGLSSLSRKTKEECGHTYSFVTVLWDSLTEAASHHISNLMPRESKKETILKAIILKMTKLAPWTRHTFILGFVKAFNMCTAFSLEMDS